MPAAGAAITLQTENRADVKYGIVPHAWQGTDTAK